MQRLNDDSLDTLFRTARTFSAWLHQPVSDQTLQQLYELAKLGPTASNSQPMRLVFVKSPEAKQRLLPALAAGNVDKVMAAPVTAIVAMDRQFYRRMPELFPHAAGLDQQFAAMAPEQLQTMLLRNASLQGGYLIMAARSLGLDCGPMSGFDQQAVDSEFFAGTSIESNFLCNLGYGNPARLHPRNPRLEFTEACRVV